MSGKEITSAAREHYEALSREAGVHPGVVLSEHQSITELQGLPAGIPVAIAAEGRWWPYVCDGHDNMRPEAETSFDTPEEALQAARDASAKADGSEAVQ